MNMINFSDAFTSYLMLFLKVQVRFCVMQGRTVIDKIDIHIKFNLFYFYVN